MPFCRNCGSPVADVDAFCIRCGAALKAMTGEEVIEIMEIAIVTIVIVGILVFLFISPSWLR